MYHEATIIKSEQFICKNRHIEKNSRPRKKTLEYVRKFSIMINFKSEGKE